MILVVTTSSKTNSKITADAKDAAEMLNAPFATRGSATLDGIKNKHNADAVLVMSKDKPVIYSEGGKFFFHLSLAELRIKNIINGKDDHMIKAMGLLPGMSFLDCTLGLGTDCIVASYVAGEKAKIVGLESSPAISFVTCLGLKNFVLEPGELDIIAALRRIQVKNISYADYLGALAGKSFDVVYFDPMFRHPINRSSNLKPLRTLADNCPVEPKFLKEACRVASFRVVMKEASGYQFEELGFSDIYGGKYSSVKYGVIDLSRRI